MRLQAAYLATSIVTASAFSSASIQRETLHGLSNKNVLKQPVSWLTPSKIIVTSSANGQNVANARDLKAAVHLPVNRTAVEAAILPHGLDEEELLTPVDLASAPASNIVSRDTKLVLAHRSSSAVHRTGNSRKGLNVTSLWERMAVLTNISQAFSPWDLLLSLGKKHVRRPVTTHGHELGPVNLQGIMLMTMVCYPVILIGALFVLSVIVGCVMVGKEEVEDLKHIKPMGYMDEPEPMAPPNERQITDFTKGVYICWVWFCCALPAIMVFGMPCTVAALASAFPQEVFLALTILTSGLVFGNGVYMAIFSYCALRRMEKAMQLDYAKLEIPITRANKEDKPVPASDVVHWVVIPQYKEDLQVVSMSLASLSLSKIAKTNINILLAMEAREEEAKIKAEKLSNSFQGQFHSIMTAYHPSDLPNDPPGKASNTAWAFKHLEHHLSMTGHSSDHIVLTISDADSEFHSGYFEERHRKLWQCPVLHLKNYHRQPLPIVVGTMFTCMQELAIMSDPNSIRFPFSTYSMSVRLARDVGGWDPNWIAEDWHMGIKCFLLTLGQAVVEPILLPVLNYTPEDNEYVSTLTARWAQAKRHALGFSDFSYYFMMLPQLFIWCTKGQGSAATMVPRVGDFIRLVSFGVAIVVRLTNVHVMLGVLTTYGVMRVFIQGVLMTMFGGGSSEVTELLHKIHVPMTIITFTTVVSMLFVLALFVRLYEMMQNRIERKGGPFNYKLVHLLKLVFCFVVFGPIYFFALGIASWKAAINMLTSNNFEYEVAIKPKPSENAALG